METFLNMGKFSVEVMPDATSIGHLRKLKKEADEAIEDPKDIFEYADCLLALFAAAYKSGFSFEDLAIASEQKLEILKTRKWKKTDDGLYQHIKKED
jgi:hypothetical protein